MRLVYFGCHEEAGHYFWRPGMARAWGAETVIPWGFDVDGKLCPGGEKRWTRIEEEVEGVARLHYRDGWTALAFWDRSIDTRPGANSVFIAEGHFTFEEMAAFAREEFAAVWGRFRFAVRLAEEKT